MVRRKETSPLRGERSLESYLREIGRYELLTRAEEAHYAERIREGDDEALDALVRANLRFVVTVAKQYSGQGLSLEDLINEGNLGLIKAGRRFDERRGFKFISYAVWWIRQSILQAIADQGRTVRLPQNRGALVQKVAKERAKLAQILGRDPRPSEVAESMELRVAEVREAMTVGQVPVSLDETTSAEDGRSLVESLPDESQSSELKLLDRSRREDIDRALSWLPPREARILSLYYGMGGDRPLTLEEIGNILGLTRERIRQLKERALRRLREHQEVAVLKDHFADS